MKIKLELEVWSIEIRNIALLCVTGILLDSIKNLSTASSN